ncbi:MAG: tetratricopeptide repeat protein, partial [Pseudomonadota bacterium]|nr:tetratricopeptide repeat protein [Pseudomonadota bacterium]
MSPPTTPAPGARETLARVLARCDAEIARDPTDYIAWHDRGSALFEAGHFAEALACYERVIALEPRIPEPHDNRGLVLQRMGRFAEAIASHDAAIARNPRFATAYLRRAMALREFGRFEEALRDAERAVALDPASPLALNGRGIVHNDLGRYQAAADDYRHALQRAPGFAEARNNLGNALHDLGHFDEAVRELDQALALRPDYADAHSNRALALQELGRLDESLAAFDRAITARQAFAEASKRRGALKLLRGDFLGGWTDYDASVHAAQARKISNGESAGIPLWAGEPLQGRSILLSEPNGLGDMLQYWRFVPMLLAMGARVAFHGAPRMFELLRSSPWQVPMLASPGEAGSFDFRNELWSLPRLLRSTPATIPTEIPYLADEKGRLARWPALLAKDCINIGVCWQGNPARKIDARRSIPLAAFAPLARVPGVRLISVQKSHGLDQLRELPGGMQVVVPGDGFDDGPNAFLDTAALMQGLDLVVTSDTAIA